MPAVILYMRRGDRWWAWPKSSWQHSQLFAVLASNSSHYHLANGVLNVNTLLSHAIFPSLCRCGFMTRKIASEIERVYQLHYVFAVPRTWTGLLSRNLNHKINSEGLHWFPRKLAPPKITHHIMVVYFLNTIIHVLKIFRFVQNDEIFLRKNSLPVLTYIASTWSWRKYCYTKFLTQKFWNKINAS